ncbi:MAG: purine-binding chemotaxis protein CheW [Chloroflexi bacterium]|nr:purine-binding chemotaxis protein CheW [Chloroflexota bacterium]
MASEAVNAEAVGSVREEQLVVFRLGDELYGIDINRVQGIERMQRVTKVPRAPEFVEGVINLRGQITPVIDLRVRLGFERVEATKESRIVVVMMGEDRVGLVVDGVDGVTRVPVDRIEPPSDLVKSEEAAYLRGIAKLDGGLLVLLDLDKVLEGYEVGRVEVAEAA